MSLDGLSLANTGLYKITPPAEGANQAEQSSKVQAETVIKKPEESEKSKSDVEDNDNEQENDSYGHASDDEDDSEDKTSVIENEDTIKKYKVKFNNLTEMIELTDYGTGFVIETISPKDLVNLFSKFDGMSGILVDKQI